MLRAVSRWAAALAAAVVGLAASLVAAAPARAEKVALVIANSAYEGQPALVNPPRDARLVEQALRQAGFASITVATDLNLSALNATLRSFAQRARGADAALIYFAGHGVEVGGVNYLIPIDARLSVDADVEFESVDLNRVLRAVEGAKVRILALDACRDNPFLPRMRSLSGRTRSLSRGLAGVEADDVLIMYAAAAGQTASDGSGANSPFAAALARRLPEPGVELRLMAGRVRDDVLAATRNQQRPFVSMSLSGQAIYLVPPAAPVLAPPTPIVSTGPGGRLQPLSSFRDCAACPEMVALPTGRFSFGSNTGDPDERPVQMVTMNSPFALSKYEITFAEYDACVADRGCRTRPSDNGWGRDNRPVINVAWADAERYALWLSRRTGKSYYVPSEAQWEYAARAGVDGDAPVGPPSAQDANFARRSGRTEPVGRFRPNAWGLHDMQGNVAEWVLNCLTPDLTASPPGSAGVYGACRGQRVVRGGSWNIVEPDRLRVTNRHGADPARGDDTIGFRIARNLE